MSWEGLSASDLKDVSEGLAEAFTYTQLPIVVQQVNRVASADFDPLYGEGVGGIEAWTSLPLIYAWPRYFPREEHLTRLGLLVGADVLLFIPTPEIQRWEKKNVRVFSLTEADQFVLEGKTYNVQKTRRDPINVGDNRATYSVGLYATGSTKPF